jgi:hypothetical protein
MPAANEQKRTVDTNAQPSSVSFTVRVTEQQHKALEALAGLERMTLAELMRQLIQDGIARGLDPQRVAEKLQQQQEEFADLQKALATGN